MNEIRFSSVLVGGHADQRRTITDIVFNDVETFFEIFGESKPKVLQIKVLQFTEVAVTEGRPVGNHLHTELSERNELFVAVGKTDADLFEFSYRQGDGPVEKKIMQAGDACLIPCGWTHTFVTLDGSAQLWGFSNTPYDSAHDIPDIIVEPPTPKA